MLLEYALGEQRSYLWTVTTAGLRSYELPPRGVIEKWIRVMVALLTARGTYGPRTIYRVAGAASQAFFAQVELGTQRKASAPPNGP